MIGYVVMIVLCSLITAVLALLTFTGYRLGFIWKREDKVDHVSVPVFSWLLAFAIAGWIFYFIMR